jgi:hypothetical protein
VDSTGATGEDNPVRRATEEVSMSESTVFPPRRANWSYGRLLKKRGFRLGFCSLRQAQGTRGGGNLLGDGHTAILMRKQGIRRVCSRDTDFHRFPFPEVVDPVQS